MAGTHCSVVETPFVTAVTFIIILKKDAETERVYLFFLGEFQEQQQLLSSRAYNIEIGYQLLLLNVSFMV